MRRILGWGLLGLVALLVNFAPAAAQSPTAPYIQYVDATNNTFIIERADGGDSRAFNAISVPPNAASTVRAVNGPGWSPSGEWFGVISSFAATDGGTITSTDIVNVDGSTRLAALTGQNVVSMAWGEGDLLLALVNTNGTTVLNMAIVNPATDSIIAQQQVSPDSTSSNFEAFWAAGLGIARLQDASGTTTITTLNPNTGAPNQFAFNNLIGISHTTGDYVIAEGQTIAYITAAGVPSQYNQAITLLEDIDFHPTQPVALMTSLDGVWLISPDELTLVLQSGTFGTPTTTVGESRVWSRDGNSALLYAGGRGVRFDLATRQTTPILFGDATQGRNIGWAGDGLLGVRPVSGASEPTYVVELETPRFNGRYETRYLPTAPQPAFSPNGQYLAQVDAGVTIFNLANRTRGNISPDSRIYNVPSWSGHIDWQADGFYFIAFTDVSRSLPRLVNVAENPYPRELPACPSLASDSTLCAFWLPPTVNTGRLPIGSPSIDPRPTVLSRGWWSTYIAWSPDGTQIAVGASPQNPASPLSSTVDIYNVATQQVIGRYPNFNPFAQEVLWDANNVGYVAERAASIQNPPVDLATSPDGSVTALHDASGVSLINTADGALLADLGPFPSPGYPRSVAFSPDGALFAFGGQIFSVGTGTVVAELPYTAQAVTFSPDGARLAATVGWDVLIFNVADLGIGN